jgi:hypothetical protein
MLNSDVQISLRKGRDPLSCSVVRLSMLGTFLFDSVRKANSSVLNRVILSIHGSSHVSLDSSIISSIFRRYIVAFFYWTRVVLYRFLICVDCVVTLSLPRDILSFIFYTLYQTMVLRYFSCSDRTDSGRHSRRVDN